MRILLFFFIPVIVFSQQPFNLETCMQYAVSNSYKTARATTELKNAKKDYTGAVLAQYPDISGTIGVISSFGRGIDPATNLYVNTNSLNNNVGLSVGIPIFNGLRYLNQTRTAKIAMLRGEEQLRQTRDKVAEETMLAYAEVVYNTGLVELFQKRIENYKMEEKKMTRLLELGAGFSGDLAQIRATLASEEYAAMAAVNNLEISILKLKNCMNYPLDETIIIEPQIKEMALYLEEQTPNEIIAYALSNNPTVIIEKRNLEIAKRTLSITRGAYYPSISLGSGISTGYFTSESQPYFTQFKNNFGEWVGAHISVPMYSGLEARLRVAKAKNNFKQAQQDYEENLRMFASEIKQAMMEFETYRSQWVQAKKNIEYQQIANQVNKRKYEEGIISIIELQTSDNYLLSAEIEWRNAYLRYQIKIREINYYKGISYVD